MKIECRAAGLTDRGMVREGNEDSILLADDLGLYAVADGMGGHNAGEVASRMAMDVIRDYITRTSRGGEVLLGGHDHAYSDAANRLASGIKLANRVIFESASNSASWRSMGTTIVAALIDGEQVSIAHAGDSRAYLVRGNEIRPLTNDHSLVAEQVRQGLLSKEEAEKSTRKNVITRALGAAADIEIDLCDLAVEDGDRMLLCSDGLSNMIADQGIAAIVRGFREPEEICTKLVEEANRCGGRDNISAVLLMFSRKRESGIARLFGWGKG